MKWLNMHTGSWGVEKIFAYSCTTKTAFSVYILKNLSTVFPWKPYNHPHSTPNLSLSSHSPLAKKIKWNQRQNVTWEAVRLSSGQQRGVKSMSGTTESLSDVLSVSQGHFSAGQQHGEKRDCVCARIYDFSKVEKSPSGKLIPCVHLNPL